MLLTTVYRYAVECGASCLLSRACFCTDQLMTAYCQKYGRSPAISSNKYTSMLSIAQPFVLNFYLLT